MEVADSSFTAGEGAMRQLLCFCHCHCPCLCAAEAAVPATGLLLLLLLLLSPKSFLHKVACFSFDTLSSAKVVCSKIFLQFCWSHLLIQVLKLGAWQLECCYLGQQHIPAPRVDVCHKRLYAVHGVERHVALILRGQQQDGGWGVREAVQLCCCCPARCAAAAVLCQVCC